MGALWLAFLQNIGTTEILVILFVILLLFGASKIPQLMRSMGSGIGEFKKGLKEGNEDSSPRDEEKAPAGKQKEEKK